MVMHVRFESWGCFFRMKNLLGNFAGFLLGEFRTWFGQMNIMWILILVKRKYGPPINDRSSPFNNEHDIYLLNHGMAWRAGKKSSYPPVINHSNGNPLQMEDSRGFYLQIVRFPLPRLSTRGYMLILVLEVWMTQFMFFNSLDKLGL